MTHWLAIPISFYHVIARLMGIAMQYARVEEVDDLLAGANFAPCSLVSEHDCINHCSGLSDLLGRNLLIENCGRDALVHVTPLKNGTKTMEP